MELSYETLCTKKEEKKFEPIPQEILSKLVNPGAAAFENCLNDFIASPSLNILKDLHFILLMDGSQYNNKIMARLPELFKYLENDEFYDQIMIMFGDISHYNSIVQNVLIENDVFKYLKLDKAMTFEFLFNFLDKNLRGCEVLEKEFEDATKHQKITKLFKK